MQHLAKYSLRNFIIYTIYDPYNLFHLSEFVIMIPPFVRQQKKMVPVSVFHFGNSFPPAEKGNCDDIFDNKSFKHTIRNIRNNFKLKL
jgi:hypothetical protein